MLNPLAAIWLSSRWSAVPTVLGAVLLSCGGALLALHLSGWDALVVTETRYLTAPETRRVEVPAACPEPAPEVAEPVVEPSRVLQRRLRGVAASRSADAIALWTKDAVYASADGGRSYRRILRDATGVRHVVVGAAGTVFAVTEGDAALWVRRRGAEEARAHPLEHVERMWVGGGRVALFGSAADLPHAFATSADYGRTWTTFAPNMGNDSYDVRVLGDGAIHVVAGSEAACGGGYQWHELGHVDGRAWKEAAWGLDAPGWYAIGERGWVYAYGQPCDDYGEDGRALCAVSPAGRHVTVGGMPEPPPSASGPVFSGRYMAYRGRLFEGRGATLREVDELPGLLDPHEGAEPGTAALSHFGVDRDGAPIALLDGHLVRWSADGGWRVELPRVVD